MEDIRIGRETGFTFRTFTVTAGTTVNICGADMSRTRLIVTFASGTNIVIGCHGQNTASLEGIVVTSPNLTQILSVEDYGELVTFPWNATANTTNATFTVYTSSLMRR